MSKGFRTLGISKSAIFLTVFMIVSTTSSFSIFQKDSDISGSLKGEKKTINLEKTGLLRKMLSRIDSDMRNRFENKNFFTNRHLYFKPRRKVETTQQQDIEDHDTQQLHSLSTFTNLENAERKPQEISSKNNNSPANADLNIPSIRRKRSSENYEKFFPNARDSKANEDIWNSKKQFSQLYHRSSSSILHILEDGSIVGKVPKDGYCVMEIKAVDHVESKTKVKIFGIKSKFYIAMNRSGHLYTTIKANDENTDFLHQYDENTYDSYLSFKHRRYITMRANKQSSSTPVKAKKTFAIPKRAYFLVSNVSHKELVPPTIHTQHSTSTQVSNHISQTAVEKVDVAPTQPETLPSGKATTITSTSEQSTTELATEPDVTSLSSSTTITTTTVATSESSTTKKTKTGKKKKCGRRCRKGKSGKRKSKDRNRKHKRTKKNKRGDKKKKRNRARKRKHRSVDAPYFNDPATQILNILEDSESENLDRVIARILQSPNFFDNPREVT